MDSCPAVFTSDQIVFGTKRTGLAGPGMGIGAVVVEESQTKSKSVFPSWSVRILLAVLTEIAGCWFMKGWGFGMACIKLQERWL